MPKKYLGDNVYAQFAGRSITLTCESPSSREIQLIVLEPQVCRELIAYSEQTLLRSQQPETPIDEAYKKTGLGKIEAGPLLQDIDAMLRDLNRLGAGNAVHLKNMLSYKLHGIRKYLTEGLD